MQKIKILEGILGSYYKSGDEILFHCPSCNHHKRKLSVNINKNKFKCWVCDYRGTSITKIVKRFASAQHKKKWGELEFEIDLSLFDKLFVNKEERPQPMELPKEFIPLCSDQKPKNSFLPIRYLKSRGVTDSEIRLWKIGYCSSGEYSGRIIIPSFTEDGDLNYFIARSYKQHKQKHKNPKVEKSKIIFNELLIDWRQTIILTEGPFDAVRGGTNSIPLLGSSLREDSKLFNKIVSHDSTVCLALDPDAKQKEMKIAMNLAKYGIDVLKLEVFPYKDLAEMPREELLRRKSEAKHFSFYDWVSYSLRRV